VCRVFIGLSDIKPFDAATASLVNPSMKYPG
jgi:hypothetical protein